MNDIELIRKEFSEWNNLNFIGQCLCVGKHEFYKKGHIYDCYGRNNDNIIWVTYSYFNFISQKRNDLFVGNWYDKSNNKYKDYYFYNVFTDDIKEIRKLKMEKINND
jgi:hypothetical protein